MSEKHRILGVHITNRVKKASDVQRLFGEYGCNIRTRLGLHEVRENYCSTNGLVLLELFGDDKLCDQLRNQLKAVEGVDVQEMVFER